MLPKFPGTEECLGKLALAYVSRKARAASPVLSEIGRHVMYEGRVTRVVRHDKTETETGLDTVTATLEVEKDLDVGLFTLEYIMKKLDEMVEQTASGASKAFYKQLNSTLEDLGRTVDMKGKPFDEGHLLTMLESIDHQFDADGSWKPPHIVVGSSLFERIKKLGMLNGEASEEFLRKRDEIINRKRDEYHRREANRILAG